MNKKHLYWIIPVAILIGIILGYFIGIYSTIDYIRDYTGNICDLI